jgi:hypothetical protein
MRWAGIEREERYIQNYSRVFSREEIAWEM